MSSTYHVVCMSHDPAIEINGVEENSLLPMLGYIDQPGTPGGENHHMWLDRLDAHKHCDLLISRSSGSFIEFTCPPLRPTQGCPGRHSTPNTERVDWLRLLYYARQSHTPASSPLELGVSRFDTGCWGARRVERLMRLVGDVYASNLEPLSVSVVGEPESQSSNDERFLGCFHGGCAAEMTMVVPAQFSDKPCGVIRFGGDVYDRASLPDRSGVWHYQLRAAA